MHPARALVLGCLLVARVATAAPVVQVPEGGRAVEVIPKGVLCGPVRGGWLGSEGRSVKPPTRSGRRPAARWS